MLFVSSGQLPPFSPSPTGRYGIRFPQKAAATLSGKPGVAAG